MPASKAVRERHSCLASSNRPGSFELNASARTSTRSSCAPVAWTTTTVAGLWSVAPFGGTMVTSRSRLVWALAFECPESSVPLLPPMPPVASTTPTATTIASTIAPVTSTTGFVAARRLEEPPGGPDDGAVTIDACSPGARGWSVAEGRPGREGSSAVVATEAQPRQVQLKVAPATTVPFANGEPCDEAFPKPATVPLLLRIQ